MKKKIISFVVSIVLLAFCFVSFGDDSRVVVAGVGDGESTPVYNVNELTDVLEFIKQGMVSDSAEFTAFSNYLGDSYYTPELSKHTSATVHVSSSVSGSSSTDNAELTGGLKSSDTSFNRELTCYFTKGATFYVTEGMCYEKTVSEKNTLEGNNTITRATVMNFNMDILVTASSCFVNFREFSYIDDFETRIVKGEYKNKWIEIPYSFVDGLISIDEYNRELLASFEEMFDYLFETGRISQNDEVIHFDENELIEIAQDNGAAEGIDPKDYDIDFTIDLSNPNASLISIKNKVDQTKTYNPGAYAPATGASGRIENKASINHTISIYNVDNTVIDWNASSVRISANNTNEFDRLFVITEFEEEE